MIRRERGVRLSLVSVGRLARELGLAPQRPLHRAHQQNTKAVDRWKREEYRTSRAQAEADDAAIWFAEEAGIRSDYRVGTTCSPVGQTPVVKNTGARYSVNMISVVSAKGALSFAVYEGTTNAVVSSDYCKRQQHDSPANIYRIVDVHPAHRATATEQCAGSTEGRLTRVCQPGNSPELNPDEWVGKNVKHDRICKSGLTSMQDLKSKAIGALRRIQKRPGLARAFYADTAPALHHRITNTSRPTYALLSTGRHLGLEARPGRRHRSIARPAPCP